MIYIESPKQYRGKKKSLFLAGGISNCKNWQKLMVKLLSDAPLVIFNPRRGRKFKFSKKVEQAQIAWEYRYLRRAAAISFWFANETVCPIVLFELGAHSMTDKPLFVGIDPLYQRRSDVEIQLKLARPDIKIVYSLADLVMQIKQWVVAK